jgi:protease-4
MFSRRHPYLFFLLVFSSIVAVTTIGIILLFALSIKDPDFEFGEKVGVIEITGVIADAKNTIHSGGYYIAAGADGIVANPGTITGSIGVIMGFANYQELLRKIGLVPIVIKSGEYKDMGSPVRKMKEEEHKILQDLTKKIHRQFIMDIVEGRKMDQAKVESLADGRIFTGEESKELGLVDRLGNAEDAIEWAGRLGGIKGKILTVYARDKKFSLLKYIMDSSIKALTSRIVDPSLSADYLYSPEKGL